MRIKIIIISGYKMYLRRSTSKFLYGNCFRDIKRASILYPPITLILPSLHTTYNRVESGHISNQRYRINPQNPSRPCLLRGKEVHKNIHLKGKLQKIEIEQRFILNHVILQLLCWRTLRSSQVPKSINLLKVSIV